MLGIEGDEGGHEGRRLLDLQAGVLARALHVQRLRRQGDLAFAAAQLLQAHVGVRGNGEDQRVDRRLAGEVLGVGGVAHHRVLLEALEHERPAADRRGVELFRGSGLHQLVGVLRRIDGGEAHAQHRQEGRVGVVENDQHLVVAAFSTRLISSGSCIDWACGKPFCATLCQGLAGSSMRWKLNTTSSASSVRLGEVGGAVEVHALAQVEAIAQAVVGHRPALGQRGAPPSPCRRRTRPGDSSAHRPRRWWWSASCTGPRRSPRGWPRYTHSRWQRRRAGRAAGGEEQGESGEAHDGLHSNG